MPISDEDQRQIIRCHESGISAVQVAQRFGIQRDAVRRILKAHGVKPHRCGARRSRTVNERYFENIDTEEKAYWLGFLLADGNITRTKKTYAVTLGLSSVDRAHVEKFAAAIESKALIVERERPSVFPNQRPSERVYSASILTVYSKPMVDDLCRLGIVPAKSKIATPWDGSPELMRHYWRGVIDGDGWIGDGSKRQGAIGVCGSEDVVWGFERYVKGIVETSAQAYWNGYVWIFSVGGAVTCKELSAHFYQGATVYLERKFKAAEKLMRHTQIGLSKKELVYHNRTEDGLYIRICSDCGTKFHFKTRPRNKRCRSCGLKAHYNGNHEKLI